MMHLGFAVLCFGAVVQVRSLLLRHTQPENSNASDVSDIPIASADADAKEFAVGRARDLKAVADIMNDVNPFQNSYQLLAPTVDGSGASSVTVPPSETEDALISSIAEGATDQGGDAVAPDNGESVNLSAPALAWLHTPKSGTSFANVLIAWGCPQLLSDMHAKRHKAIANKFCNSHKNDCATGHSLCSSHTPINFKIDTAEATHSWIRSKGHFVGMFRNPEQRHISGFYDGQLMSTYGVEVYHGFYENMLDYAKANAGCSTKLLIGKPCNDKYNATANMVERAALNLETGFAFVGLTEEWALSVCLFHVMFGGQCYVQEFGNVRPGVDRKTETYNTAELEGWMDPFDGPIYERAKLKFWSNVVRFNVSSELCKNTVCPQAAQYF